MLKMKLEPDNYTFTFVLKACTKALDLQMGIIIHKLIAEKELEDDVFIGTALVDMYCRMGQLDIAKDLFDKMPERDIVAWNAMIAGLSHSSCPDKALGLLKNMHSIGLLPNSVSFLNLFPAVSKLSDVKSCTSVHGYVFKRQFSNSVMNGLIDAYSKCNNIDYARRIFNMMSGRDDVCWGTMMAGYVYNGGFCEVLELFDQMKREKIMLNKVSAVSAILAATELRDIEKGKEIHDLSTKQGIDLDKHVATSITCMYIKFGELEMGKELFNKIQGRDLVAWSALIAAFVQAERFTEALKLFLEMQNENLKPNRVTLLSIVPACAKLSFLELGKSLHCYSIKAYNDDDILLSTALISLYAKCGLFNNALTLFYLMPYKEVVTWNALINGYAQIGDSYNSLDMFSKLRLSGMKPDAGTMVGVLPACALLNDLNKGSSIHGVILKSGFESDFHLKNSLIDMYAKCGSLSSAELLFRKSGFNKDLVSYNVIISAYVQNGHPKEAMFTLNDMKVQNFKPNVVTLVSVLPAVADLGALREGMAFHAYIVNMGFQFNTQIGNSLIDMYAKCGRLDFSEKFFQEMENKDIISWNSMLAGYAVNGNANRAIDLFLFMQEKNAEIDSVSFLSVLSACRHAGLVEEGRKIFVSMKANYHLDPNLEHYACLVDLLARAGLFDETMDFIEKMPLEPDAGIWGALLSASRMYSNLELGKVALGHLIKLEPWNSAHYVVLSNIYAQAGMWNDARNLRSKMNETGLKKTLGYSWVDTKNKSL